MPITRRMRLLTAFSCSIFQVFMFSDALAQESKPFRIQSEVELVAVEVAALDKGGNSVNDLKMENFRILEDGKEQRIESFDKAVESTQNIERMNDNAPLKGKTVLILFDDGTISGENIKRSRDSAALFVKEHMKPQDWFAIASFGFDLEILQNLSNDPQKILKAIAQSTSRGSSSPSVVQSEGLLRALEDINISVERLKGQKSVLVYSRSSFVSSNLSEKLYKAALTSAKRSNVAYHVVDPGGLTATQSSESSSRGLPDSMSRMGSMDSMNAGGGVSALKSLAYETGGTAIFNSNNYDSELTKVNTRLSNYYIIGFSSSNPKHDGKLRKLDVRIDRKDVLLKYRDSYYDRRPVDLIVNSKQEDKLLGALASPESAAQLPVNFRPAFFYNSSRLLSVLIFAEIGMEKASLVKKGDQLECNLNVMGAAYAENGRMAARFSEPLNRKFEKEKDQDVRKMNLPYRNYFTLQPGNYRLKLAVSDEKNNLATIEKTLEAPVKPQQGFALSSLVIVAHKTALPNLVQNIQTQLMDDSDPLIFRGMQIDPSVSQRLPVGSAIPLLVKIYKINGGSGQWTLRGKARLVNEKNENCGQVAIDLKQADLEIVSNSDAAALLNLNFPEAKPGKYILSVEISEPGSSQTSIAQTDLELIPQ
jgi:VWFA-related protein